jgi:hypothetical protein
MSDSPNDTAHFRNDGSGCKTLTDCPLAATHSRLSEAHRHFHEAEANYSDPEAFTAYLNSCIQSLRNVTFVLQKSKGLILGFEQWYQPWQNRMRDDPVLRWLVEARNQIVKCGDLETHSVANIAIVDDYSDSQVMQVPFPPTRSLEALSEDLIDRALLPAELKRASILRIERRWVASDLPQFELLHVLAHGYTTLAYLIQDAHRPLSRAIATTDLPEQLPGQPLSCMANLEESRVFHVRFHDFDRPAPRREQGARCRRGTETLWHAARRTAGSI